jgi:hypothetical protein
MIKLQGCIYALWINNKPYIGQSRQLDKNKLPSLRWRRHINDSKTSDIYLYKAIRSHGITNKEVIEYIDYEFNFNKEICINLIKKIKTNKKLIKYVNILKYLLNKTNCNLDELDKNIDSENNITNITEEENKLIFHINQFLDNVNKSEIKNVEKYNSMMPELGGNGYNHAPPGGVFLHEPLTEEQKNHLSKIKTGSKLSEETKIKLSIAKSSKPASDKNKNGIAKALQNKFNNERFPKRLAEWIIQYNKLGHKPNQNSIDVDERRAGQWHSDILAKRDGKTSRVGLTDEQIEILNKTTGWIWKIDEFIEQFENFKKQYIKYDGKLFTKEKNPELRDKYRAAHWVASIRLKKRNNSPYLTNERLKMLNDCEYWNWEQNIISFDDHVKKWEEIYTKINHIPSTCSKDIEEKKIAAWQNRIRRDYNNKEKRMTQDKIDKLNSVKGWLWIF